MLGVAHVKFDPSQSELFRWDGCPGVNALARVTLIHSKWQNVLIGALSERESEKKQVLRDQRRTAAIIRLWSCCRRKTPICVYETPHPRKVIGTDVSRLRNMRLAIRLTAHPSSWWRSRRMTSSRTQPRRRWSQPWARSATRNQTLPHYTK